MAKYLIETDQGKFEVETEEPTFDAPDFMPVGQEKSFLTKVGEFIAGGPAKSITQKIIENPRESILSAVDFLPVAGSIALPVAGAASTAGVGASGALGLSALGSAGGEGVRQLVRRGLGAEPAPPIPIPFTKKTIPRIPGASPEISNVAEEAILASAPGLAARAIAPIARAAGRGAARVGQVFSGIKPEDYARLAKDPTAILPAGLGGPQSIEKAGQGIGKATAEMQVSATLDPLPRTNSALKEAVEIVMEDVPRGIPDAQQAALIKKNIDKLNPQQTYEAYRDVNDLLKGEVMGKNKTLRRARTIWLDVLRSRLGSLSDEYAKASKEFARASVRKTFRNIFPVTKYGESSIGRLGFGAPVLGPLGYAAGGPVGAAALSLLGSSPAVHGVVTAGTGAAARGVGAASRTPGTLPAIFATAKRRSENEKGKQKR